MKKSIATTSGEGVSRRLSLWRQTRLPGSKLALLSLSHSGFDDSVGAQVSLDRGRSLTGRAGALAERVFGEGRVFGSVDVEHEFDAETRMSVAGASFDTAGEETRRPAGVGAEHGWDDGGFALRGALGYTGSGGGMHDYGGRASLSMRFRPPPPRPGGSGAARPPCVIPAKECVKKLAAPHK